MIRLFGTTTIKDKRKETARRLLAFAAFQCLNLTELPAMDRQGKGKPFFPDRPQLRFNLSHSGEWVLCALSDEGEVGVDIEAIRPRKDGLPRYAMTDEEFASFDGSWEDFFRIWTLKEAYVKYQGGSIANPASVPVPPPVPHRSYGGDGWRAALCGEGPLPPGLEWVDPSSLSTETE